jgi:hypothetical protein
MADKHWNDDELIGRLYGVGPEDGHLEECRDCAGRWRQLLAVRRCVLEAPEPSQEFLAAQRRALCERIERGDAPSWRVPFIPSMAGAVMMLLLGFLLSGPRPAQQPSMAASSDVQLTEVYAAVQDVEPAAVEPIHGLFEENQ